MSLRHRLGTSTIEIVSQAELCAEAATVVIAGQRSWLAPHDFVAAYLETFPAFDDATTMAAIGWDAGLAAIDTGKLVCSASEEQMLRIAASLAGYAPVDLSEALTGPDDRNLAVVLAAIAHTAAGSHHRGTHAQPAPAPNISTPAQQEATVP